jgi:hypothetical protein
MVVLPIFLASPRFSSKEPVYPSALRVAGHSPSDRSHRQTVGCFSVLTLRPAVAYKERFLERVSRKIDVERNAARPDYGERLRARRRKAAEWAAAIKRGEVKLPARKVYASAK